MAEGAVHDAVRAYRQNPDSWTRNYQRIKGVPGYPLLEMKIGGGPRLIAHWSSPRLTLLEVGNHEVVSRAPHMDLERALTDVHEPPRAFDPATPADFFLRLPDRQVFDWGNEMQPDWLYQLDRQQWIVLERLREAVQDAYLGSEDTPDVMLVMGGPGTGKTSVLANLADYVHTELQLTVRVLFPQHVLQYVAASTAGALPWEDLWNRSSGDILLIDDPASLEIVTGVLASPFQRAALVVAALDPLQLDKALADGELDDFMETSNVELVELSTCYRQKENVGLQALQVMDKVAASTPFLDSSKIDSHHQRHERLTRLANKLHFVNPHGYTEVHDPATPEALQAEIRRFHDQRRLWKHWPSLLLAAEHAGPYEEVEIRIGDSSVTNAAICGLEHAKMVKGVEFPHVFVFLRRSTFEEITRGFRGSGRKLYDSRRLLRIPFSRARDSLVIFVVEDQADWASTVRLVKT